MSMQPESVSLDWGGRTLEIETGLFASQAGGSVTVRYGDTIVLVSATMARHPRTAIGSYVRDKRPHLILFVVDGRQKIHSMGMSLPELAQAMKDLGCTEALNLDGGGSSTIVVKDKVLNKPSDGRQRNVTSIIGIVPAQ